MSTDNLFEKYGGFATVSKLVHEFYDRIRRTPELDIYFDGIDLPRLIKHQTQFLGQVLGGPADYDGRELGRAHKRFQITVEHFDLVAEILEEVLEDGGVEDDDVAKIMNIVAGTREVIVERAAA